MSVGFTSTPTAFARFFSCSEGGLPGTICLYPPRLRDFANFKVLLVSSIPSLETFMISLLGTFQGVLICIPATWFGALNITPFKPITYPIGRLLMTLSRSIHEIVWALFFVSVFGLGALS